MDKGGAVGAETEYRTALLFDYRIRGFYWVHTSRKFGFSTIILFHVSDRISNEVTGNF